jgi:hypothetical protein
MVLTVELVGPFVAVCVAFVVGSERRLKTERAGFLRAYWGHWRMVGGGRGPIRSVVVVAADAVVSVAFLIRSGTAVSYKYRCLGDALTEPRRCCDE